MAVVAGNFSRNGNIDLVVVDEANNEVDILTGNGDGTFNNTTYAIYDVGTSPDAIATADFNGDNLPIWQLRMRVQQI